MDVQDLNNDALQQFSVMAWVIWTGRNQELHREGRNEASRSAAFALDYIKEFNEAQRSNDIFHRASKHKGGVGIVIHNSAGDVMGMLAGPLNFLQDPFIAEAMAAEKALKFAKDMGFGCIELKGDAVGILNRLVDNSPDLSVAGVVLEEGKVLLQSFRFCKVMHTRRDGNRVAHALAQMGVGLSSDMIWVEEFPDSLYNVVSADVYTVDD
ncbi:hypothetical protein PTKIN_Ptkin09bG0164200 [Pterospermum kingtungense]